MGASLKPRLVLIVDDNASVRTALRVFFEKRPGWEVAGEAKDGAEAIDKGLRLKPDLIVLDVRMPMLNGLAAASVLKKRLAHAYIIVFTMHDDSVGRKLSAASGVDLVVSKADGVSGLVAGIQKLTGAAEMAKQL